MAKKTVLKTKAKQEKEALKRKREGYKPAIDKLEKQLHSLKLQYDLFFSGANKLQPSQEESRFKNDLQKLKTAQGLSTEEKFRVNGIKQKYLSLNQVWLKNSRNKDSVGSSDNLSLTKDKAKQVFNAIHKVMTTEITMDKVEKFIKEKTQEIQKKTGKKDIEFQVVVKDGKVGLVGKPKKS